MDISLLQKFVSDWTGRGYEKGETQPFWIALLAALGVEDPTQYIRFEDQVHLDHTSFIDGHIPATHVLIEQKSIAKDLGAPIRQSDGSLLNPFQQAKRYSAELPYDDRPRWIVTCNFREFWIYDMNQPNAEPTKVLLENLVKEHYLLAFLVKKQDEHLQREMELSMQAGELVGQIYDKLILQYHDPTHPESLRSLNQLCVRLVFLLFAEDAELFGDHNAFHNYMSAFPAHHWRRALIDLFRVLDTPVPERDPYLDEDLKGFPYVNRGLFSDSNIEIPQFTEELKQLILTKASADFDWSEISPTIFGGVFESTLNPETRRSGGMHYTSIENIHKVIDPLFMHQLEHDYEQCTTKRDLLALQDKLASLTFFDPACGSGNFLTETYISLRRLENKIIARLQGGQAVIGEFVNPIKVDIHQFYGIEINDFAVSVATTALWIAELQMLRETRKVAHFSDTPLPLKTYHNIHEGNALRIDWAEVLTGKECTQGIPSPLYIIGNPPFIGYSLQSVEQKEDMLNTLVDVNGKPYKQAGKIDYVSGWYYKACKMMDAQPTIKAAFVSTNSITQGEQVAGLWKPLVEQFGIHIDFAYPTFRWDSESNLKAHVHCVIVGFSKVPNSAPRLYKVDGTYKVCTHLNAYLVDGLDAFVESRNKPICDVPQMITGNRPADGGHLIIEAEEFEDFVAKEPGAIPYIKNLTGALEYINNKKRYCLWLVGMSPAQIKSLPLVYERVRLCKEDRENAPDPGRRKLAATPHLFREQINPDNYMIVPRVSSENRRYIPIGYLGKDTIPTDSATIIPNATLYHFGVLTSNVHMAWMRAVCGRLKSDYRYSKDIVYNNFPWAEVNETQQAKIAETAQGILDARALYPDCSLADLYDEVTMPIELRRAHQANDRAVMQAYGFPIGMSESECVARLLEMYQAMVQEI